MAHDHDHGHGVSESDDRRWLGIALALILAFMCVEIVAGILADSLALLSDAAHMLTDAAALALAIWAASLAARPAGGRFTFGMGRAEVLSAQINGATLLVLAALIGFEAVGRLFDPPDVEGAIVIVVGTAGALVNIAAAWALSKAQRRSLNVEGARQHILTDLYASLAAVAAGVLVLAGGFREADGIAALVVAGLMLRSGWRLVRDSGRVLMESAPEGIDPEEIGMAMAGTPGVVEVHDLHIWEVTTGFPALAAHAIVPAGDDCHERRRELDRMLGERFGIKHVTIQVEHARREHELLQVERPGARARRD